LRRGILRLRRVLWLRRGVLRARRRGVLRLILRLRLLLLVAVEQELDEAAAHVLGDAHWRRFRHGLDRFGCGHRDRRLPMRPRVERERSGKQCRGQRREGNARGERAQSSAMHGRTRY
jgi:hypothetical protein